MTLDEARRALAVASADFESAIGTFKYPDRSFTEMVVGGWRTAVATASGTSRVSYRDALKGLEAAHSILYDLANASGDPDEVRGYADDMEKLTAEAKRIVAEGWAKSESNYAPITAEFRKATDRLKKALETAKAQAQALNLAADLLSAFARLLTVV